MIALGTHTARIIVKRRNPCEDFHYNHVNLCACMWKNDAVYVSSVSLPAWFIPNFRSSCTPKLWFLFYRLVLRSERRQMGFVNQISSFTEMLPRSICRSSIRGLLKRSSTCARRNSCCRLEVIQFHIFSTAFLSCNLRSSLRATYVNIALRIRSFRRTHGDDFSNLTADRDTIQSMCRSRVSRMRKYIRIVTSSYSLINWKFRRAGQMGLITQDRLLVRDHYFVF